MSEFSPLLMGAQVWLATLFDEVVPEFHPYPIAGVTCQRDNHKAALRTHVAVISRIVGHQLVSVDQEVKMTRAVVVGILPAPIEPSYDQRQTAIEALRVMHRYPLRVPGFRERDFVVGDPDGESTPPLEGLAENAIGEGLASTGTGERW